MTRATFTLAFYVKRSKALNDGRIPVYARITVNRKTSEFGLQRYVNPDGWDSKKGKAIPNCKQNKELNNYLETIKGNIFIKKRELEEQGISITADVVKKAYQGLDESNLKLLEIFKVFGGCVVSAFARCFEVELKVINKHGGDIIDRYIVFPVLLFNEV